MPAPRLLLGQLNRQGQTVSVYRTFYAPRQRYGMHDHDFAELFWIERGHGRQILEDGTVHQLAPGDVCHVLPDTIHALEADARRAMVLVNVAFDHGLLGLIQPLVQEHDWPWGRGAEPRRLDEAGQAAVAAWIPRLSADGADPLDLAAFLLELARRLRGERPAEGAGLPPWLASALEQLDEPRHLAAGVPELVRLTGRGAAHISRIVRRASGCTTIQLINRRRLAWLARELRLSQTPVAELALSVGLPNLSHAYGLFRRTYGCSPVAYRRMAQG